MKNFCAPPLETNFWALFDYFWDNGVGNELNADGEPVAWSELTLEAALDFKPVSKTLGDWHKRGTLPSKASLHRLCRMIFREDEKIRKAWSDALIETRRAEELERDRLKTVQGQSVETPAKEVNSGKPLTLGKQRRNDRLVWVFAPIGIILVVGFSFLILRPSQPSTIGISDIRFCSEANFSVHSKACQLSETHFPRGTQKVYVSYLSTNIPFRSSFSRRWYRNGEKFIERNDFSDAAWENYTWIYNRHGHDQGEYVMRIVVADQVFSGRFTLGDL